MKIYHISDLHLDKNFKKSNYYKTHCLLERIVDEGFDHLVISGDITENAESSAFEIARGLLKKFGLHGSEKATVVIGNHDIYGGVHLAEDVLSFPAKCRTTNYYEKVKDFEYYFRETFENTIAPARTTFFPFIKEFDEFLLIGLNSISEYSVLKNPFASNGEIGIEQFRLINEILSHKSFKGKKKIAVSHHHFCKDKSNEQSSTLWQVIERQTMKLKNKKSTIKKLKKLGIDMVLHGHLHETNEYHRKGIKFINSGGSILGYKPNEIKITEINITGKQITSQVKAFNIVNAERIYKEPSFPKRFYTSLETRQEICLN
jgi:3',5'-cyclic AMP phosphodiesterase CpdA